MGFANLKLYREPFEFYLVPMVLVGPEKQGHGYGSRILEEITKRLDERGVPGLLMNAVDPQSPARGMYERHGWVAIPGHENWLGYKTDSVNHENIDQVINRLEKKTQKKPTTT